MRVPRLALAGLAAASSLPVLAEGSGTSTTSIDLSAAEGLATTLGSSLSGFVTGNVIPAVVLVIGAIASLLLLYRLVRWLLRALGGR